MLQNVQEQDYFVKDGKGYTLKGISFSLIIEPRNSDNSVLAEPMSNSDIESYGRECIQKFYNVIRQADEFKKVKDLPIQCIKRLTLQRVALMEIIF